MRKFWSDDRGALLSAEWVFMATLLVIGLVVGWHSVQVALVQELEEVANAVGIIDQSYGYCGIQAICSFSAGSFGGDTPELALAIEFVPPFNNISAFTHLWN